MNRDLTTGAPARVLWRFCLPLFFSALVQQFYIVADSLVAGRYIGEVALAAVGNTYQITLVYQAILFGCVTGCAVVLSRLFGAGDGGAVRAAARTALLATGALCLVLSAAGAALAPLLLRLMKTPADAMTDALRYLQIYTLGLIVQFGYQLLIGMFAALGDAKTPLILLSASSVINILLDVLLVKNVGLGVRGIAWATVLAQGVCGIAALVLLQRRLCLFRRARAPRAEPIFSMPIFGSMLRIALPVTMQQLIVALGGVLIQAMVNGFGVSVSAGYAAAIKINNLAIAALMAFDKGMASYAAQNAGANRTERIRGGLGAGWKLSAAFALCIAAGYLAFQGGLMRQFLEAGAETAKAAGEQFIRIVVPFYLVVAVKIACDGVLRGLGAMRPLLTATVADLTLRVGFAFLLSRWLGSVGIWLAWPFGWTTGTALSAIFAVRRLRRAGKTESAI